MLNIRSLTRTALIALATGVLAIQARAAGFVSPLAIPDGTSINFVMNNSTAVGDWAVVFAPGTSIAPAPTGNLIKINDTSISLVATSTGSGMVMGTIDSSLTLSWTATQTGVISFDVLLLSTNTDAALNANNNKASYSINSTPTLLALSDHVAVNVVAGDVFALNVLAQGKNGSMIPFPTASITAVTTLSISNFDFTAVPEPSTYAFGLGLITLATVVCLRRRK